jgi:anaphase-promoting complex subunit 8
LIKSLNQFPYNWSAWVELCLICKQSDMVWSIYQQKSIFTELKDHWMKTFMITNFLLEKNYEQESIQLCNSLLQLYQNSYHLLNSLAHSYYLLNGTK